MLRVCVAMWLLALAASAPAAEMYRWVDKDGKLHFSDQPPPADAKQSSQLKAAVDASSSESREDETAADRAERMRRAADSISADRDARQRNKAESTANRAKKERDCAAARAELERFETANVKFMRDENNQQHEMTDSEHKDVAAELRAQIEKSCR